MNACRLRWRARVWPLQSGAQIIRAHDVAETVQAVRMTEAVLARKKK